MRLPAIAVKRSTLLKLRRYTASLLVLAVLFGTAIGIAPQTASARTVDEIVGDINELNTQVRNLDAKIQELESQISEKQGEIRTLKNDVALLNTEIDKLDLEIENTQKKILRAEAEIEKATIGIRTKEKEILDSKEALGELIREINEADHVNPFEILIAGKSFSEILNSFEHVQTIQKKVQESLDTIQQLKLDLEAKRLVLEDQRNESVKLRSQLEGQHAALQSKRAEKDQLIKETKNEEANYKKLLAQTEDLQEQAVADIRDLEKELASKSGGSSNAVPAGKGILLMPTDGVITQGYGKTEYSEGGAYGGANHNGVDIANSLGTNIYSAADGVVAATGSLGGVAYGEWVGVHHPSLGLWTLYGHMLSSNEVSAGQSVVRGEGIGHMGSTGYSTGSHLHFMVCLDFYTTQKPYGLLPYCNHVNPLNYL
jgi:murein DD-endopeptidase MepM/ murein hydrolase activator NlpD